MRTPAFDPGAARLAVQRQVLETLSLVAAVLIAALAMLRASTTLVVFPGWDMDPMSMAAPAIGLGPAASLGLDCVLITLSGALIALSAPLVGRFPATGLILFLAGGAAIAWHGVFSKQASQENLLIGLGWAAAMSVAISLAHAGRLESVRRAVAAVAFAFLGALAMKCAAQVWIENKETIDSYRANREAILASHGWAADSFAARTFERRLYDASGTGWFGLSNIVATFGAAGVAAFGVLCFRERESRGRWLAAVGIVLATLCVWLAGSKGGWAAAGVGLAVGIGGAAIVGKRRGGGVLLFLAIPLATIGAVVARGIAGERFGELSLLFRSQYLAAAAKIFVSNPVAGVGPAGFKDAYLLAKSPLSPEEVSSPHSVLFDFAATLGLGGVAWAILWLTLLALAGANLSKDDREEPAGESGAAAVSAFRFCALGIAIATVGGAWLESAIATPLSGVMRIAALGLGLTLAWRVCSARPGALRISLAAAAAACGFHAMIEVTPVQAGSSALFAVVLGIAAAPPGGATAQARRGVLVRAIPGLFIAVLGILASFMIGRVQRWEWHLLSGAERLAPIAALTQALSESTDDAAVRSAAEELTRQLGTSVAPNRQEIGRSLVEARRKAGLLAYQDLIRAISEDPTSQLTRQAASNLALQLATLEQDGGAPSSKWLRSASILAEDASRLPWHRAPAEAWLATVKRGIGELTRDRAALEGAYIATVNASALDPHNPLHAVNAARLAQRLGNGVSAREWAARALRLDENMRLDPLRRLDAKARAELEGLSKSGG
ncbi:MAG: O-antigen ligase family protein [Phycisphaerae bacterium]|nr:O-antigen ligase family protein [Phycisphaerae bacterium]